MPEGEPSPVQTKTFINIPGYYALAIDLFADGKSNSQTGSADILWNRAMIRAIRLNPWLLMELAQSLNGALADMVAKYDKFESALAKRRALAIRHRYGLDEDTPRFKTYSEVGLELARHASGGDLLNPRGGVSASRAREIVLSGLKTLQRNSIKDPVFYLRWAN